jgi:hypothetical protein
VFLSFVSRDCGSLNTALRSRGHQSVNGSPFAAHKRQKPPAGCPYGGFENKWKNMIERLLGSAL